MNSRNLKLVASVGLAVMVTVATGCAGIGMHSDAPADEVVRERAQAWADDLRAGKLEDAWALTSPAYRQFTSAEQYKVQVAGSTRWTSAVVNSVKCAEDICDVALMVEYHIKRLDLNNQTMLEQKWVQVAGEWWLHVPAK
jgi:hypothetical protein